MLLGTIASAALSCALASQVFAGAIVRMSRPTTRVFASRKRANAAPIFFAVSASIWSGETLLSPVRYKIMQYAI